MSVKKESRRFLRIPQWMLVGLALWMSCLVLPSSAKADDWAVKSGARRHQIVLRRFRSIVERNPVRGFAYSRMFKLARRSPGLVRFIRFYARRVKRSPRNLKLRLILGHLYADTRQNQKALAQYKAVLAINAKHPSAHLYRATLFKRINQTENALNAYKAALQNARSKQVRRRCLKQMGALALVLKRPKQALAWWNDYLKLSPRNSTAREEIARSLVRYKLYVQARGQLAIVLKRTRGRARRARLYRKVGDIFEQEEKWKMAVSYFRKAMKLTGRTHWLRRELSERILQLHREKGELPALVAWLQAKKRKSKAELSQIARLYDEIGKNEAAEKAYQLALKANPRDTKLRLKYITLLEVQNKNKKAIQQYRTLIRLEPRESRYRLSFIEMLSRLGRRRESLQEMRTLTKVFSRKSEVLSRIAQLYRRRRMTKEAIALYKRLISLEPREASHIQSLGDYYYSMSQWKKARKTWMRIWQRIRPRHQAASLLGQIFRDHNQMDDARKWLQKAVKLKPSDVGHLKKLGNLYQRILDLDGSLSAKQLKDAIRIWKTLVKKSKKRTQRRHARFQLFAFYYAQGTLYRLPDRYQRRLVANPRDIEARRFLGEYALWRSQKLGRRTLYLARSQYQKILQIKKNDLDALLTLEQLEARRQRYRAAQNYLLRVIKVRKQANRNDYRRLYGYALKLGDYEKAIKYGRRVVTLFPSDASTHAELAQIYMRASRRADAIRSYQEAIRLRPRNYSYQQSLANIYYKDGQLQRAAVLYRKVLKNARDGRVLFEAAKRAMEILMSNKTEIRRLEGQLQSLAERHPRELAYFRALAEMYRRQGRMKEYQNAFLKAAATVDDKAQVYRTLAEVAQEQGELKKAIIYYRKMLEESSNPTTSEQLHLARLYMQVDQKQPAQKILAALLNENPNSLRVMREIADLLYTNNMIRHATKAYENYLELDPSESMVRLRLGGLYRKMGAKEAARGLYASIVWDNQEKPLVHRRRRKKAKKKSKLPYYLRRRSYFQRRVRLNRARTKALAALVELHEEARTLDSFERRAMTLLKDYNVYNRNGLLTQIVNLYIKRKWYQRLKVLLENLYARDPNNSKWIRLLASVYKLQKKYVKAYRLYTKVERLQPRWKHSFIIPKLEILLAMKSDQRLNYALMGYLRGQTNYNWYTFLRILRLLKNHKKYDVATKSLKWAIKYTTNETRSQILLTKLVELQLLRGRSSEGRKLLLVAWFKKGSVRSYRYSIQRLIARRGQLLNRLWPLLEPDARKTMLETAKKKVFRLSLSSPMQRSPKKRTLQRIQLRLALVDAYLVTRKLEGTGAAMAYLPSLWGIAGKFYTDRYYRSRLPMQLLREKKFKVAGLLLQQQMKTTKTGILRMKLLYNWISLLRRVPQPSRQITRFLEQKLISFRTQVKPEPWRWMLLQLSNLYLHWGAHRRVIWWIERCRWIGGEKLRQDNEFQLHLARAYKRQGKEKVAQKYFRGFLQEEWKTFLKNPLQGNKRLLHNRMMRTMVLYPTRYSRYRYRSRYRSRYLRRLLRLRRYYRRRRLLRRYSSYASMGEYYQYQRQILYLYRLYDEAGQLALLDKQLKEHRKKLTLPRKRRQALMFRVIFLTQYWRRTHSAKSIVELLSALQELEVLSSRSRARYFANLRGRLLVQTGKHRKALKVYQKMLAKSKKSGEASILREIAKQYAKLGLKKKEYRVRLRLSNLHKDRYAHLWLAVYHRKRREFAETIRYYRKYIRLRYSSRMNQYYQAKRYFEVAKFLLAADERVRSVYFLQQTLNTLRQDWMNKSFRLSKDSLLKQSVALFQKAGRLRDSMVSWERRHLGQKRVSFWLKLLYYGYGLQHKRSKQHVALRKILVLEPNNTSLFKQVLASCRRVACFRKLAPFLEKTLQGKTARHREYHVYMADLYNAIGLKKEAVAHLDKQFANAKKNRYSLRVYGFRTAAAALSMGLKKQSLKYYLETLSGIQTNSYYWSYTIRAVEHMLKHKAYREAVTFLKRVIEFRGRSTSSAEDLYNVSYLATAYWLMGDRKRAAKELAWLKKASVTNIKPALLLAKTFERCGEPLHAERMYWSGFRFVYKSSKYRPLLQRSLCRIWKKQGLDNLCNFGSYDMDTTVQTRKSLRLGRFLVKQKQWKLALLTTRLAWLNDTRNPELLKMQALMSARLGRLREATELKRLYETETGKTLKTTLRPTPLPGRVLRWKVQVPSWCPGLQIRQGRLDLRSCLPHKRWLRCSRRMARSQGRVFLNNCSGQIVAFEEATGRALWIHRLPALKNEVVVRRDLHVATRREKRQIFRYFYTMKSMKVVNGKLFVAVNQNSLEIADSSASGIRTHALLRALNPATGQVLWKRKLASQYVAQKLVKSGSLLGFFGRQFQVVSSQNGKFQWSSAQGRLSSAWLWGGKNRLPVISIKGGFVLSGQGRTLTRLDLQGRKIWQIRLPWSAYSLAADATRVYALTAGSNLLAIGLNNHRILWKKKVHVGTEIRQQHLWYGYFYEYLRGPELRRVGKQLLLSGTDGQLVSIATQTGAVQWKRYLGTHAVHRFAVDQQAGEIALAGEHGSIEVLGLKQGKHIRSISLGGVARAFYPRREERDAHLHFYRVTSYIKTRYPYSGGLIPSSSGVVFGSNSLLSGAYSPKGDFTLYSFWRKQSVPQQKKWKELLLVLQNRKNRLLFSSRKWLLSLSLGRNEQERRKHYLWLAKQTTLPMLLRFRMLRFYLLHSRELGKDLKRIQPVFLSLSRKMGAYSRSVNSMLNKSLSHRELFLLVTLRSLLHSSNDWKWKQGLRQVGLAAISSPRGQAYHSYRSALMHRLLRWAARHSSPEVQEHALRFLALWRDDIARKPLLTRLVKRLSVSGESLENLQKIRVRLLVRWNKYFEWKGLLLPSDAKRVKPLLKSKIPEVRLTVAKFLGELATYRKEARQYNTSAIRQILFKAIRLEATPHKEAFLALVLAKLGDRRGVRGLRSLYRRSSGYFQTRMAAILINDFRDFTGLSHLIAKRTLQRYNNPVLPSFRVIFGNLLHAAGMYSKSIPVYKELLEMKRKHVTPNHRHMAWYGMGRGFYQKKQYSRALKMFQNALREDNDDLMTKMWMGATLMQLKRYKKAVALLESLQRATPSVYLESAWAFALGRAYAGLGQTRKVHGLFKKMKSWIPFSSRVHYEYARVLLSLQTPDTKGALAAVEQALKTLNDLPDYLLLKAKILHKMGQKAEAEKFLKKAWKESAFEAPRRQKIQRLYRQWFPNQTLASAR